MSSETRLELKSINDLLGYKFVIPSYQRGYRWTELQVKQLLDDIWEFAQKHKAEEEFYCLQPVVVKKISHGEFEVIDGQQRLTTIYMILSYLEKEHLRRPFYEAYKKNNFFLFYETREKSADFLKNQLGNGINDENIDFFYMSKAYETVKSWFKDKDYNECDDFLKTLLAKRKNPVKVIWYEINERDSDPIEIFTRLNIGKIPLTNSELVKALLLKKDNFNEEISNIKQIQIATEWDMIEKSLQDNSFWYFIYNPSNPLKYENRIEYILDLMSKKKPGYEYYHTFNYFYKEYLNKNKNADDIWLDIKKFYLTFEEWYKDFELYHYIGFLIAAEKPKNNTNLILEIREESKGRSKDDFKRWLKKKIKSSIRLKENEAIEDLQYGDDRIGKILLLFNIQTILNSRNENNRFPFNKFKLDNWDVEHVRSRTDKEITSYKEQKEWINLMLEYFTGESDVDKIKSIYDKLEPKEKEFCEKLIELKGNLEEKSKKEKLQEDFSKIYEELQEYYEGKQTDTIDSISNLALLDAGTNRSYKNAFFPVKRRLIIENDKKGKFVPIATKNLFLKYYSPEVSNVMYWMEDDAEYYLNAMKETLKEYLSDSLNGGDNEQ